MPNQRYKLTIAYRGTAYYGWQKQMPTYTYKGPPLKPGEGLPTIQGILAREIMHVVRHPINLVGSSRTDSGVHAKGQLAHFDTDQVQIPPEGMRRALNHHLPDDIIVRSIEPVPDWFDAILSTTRKRYQYQLWNAEDRPVFFGDMAWHRWQGLDLDAMKVAAKFFEGEHDFKTFANPHHGRENTVRTIHECRVSHRGPRVVIGIEGSGFLWQMIRIMVGTLVEIGLGQVDPTNIPAMLAARDRRAAGQTAPAHGLFLQWIRTTLDEENSSPPARVDTHRPSEKID